MICECCQECEATIHLTQVVDQNAREVHLCATCAEKNGLNLQSAMSLPEMLFNLATDKPAGAASTPEKGCPQCHLRSADFKKNGRLGCPVCYASFAGELQQILAGMQSGPIHNGKRPRQAPPAPVPVQSAPPRRKRKTATAPSAIFEKPATPSIPPPSISKTTAPDSSVSRKLLERQLAKAIQAENYEEAARLRDALQQEKPGA
ncbi:MAG: UvrB/UvrC motif-containing protein [bacterium]